MRKMPMTFLKSLSSKVIYSKTQQQHLRQIFLILYREEFNYIKTTNDTNHDTLKKHKRLKVACWSVLTGEKKTFKLLSLF
jgi:hypothetical protein